jgi:hypothetical protein
MTFGIVKFNGEITFHVLVFLWRKQRNVQEESNLATTCFLKLRFWITFIVDEIWFCLEIIFE